MDFEGGGHLGEGGFELSGVLLGEVAFLEGVFWEVEEFVARLLLGGEVVVDELPVAVSVDGVVVAAMLVREVVEEDFGALGIGNSSELEFEVMAIELVVLWGSLSGDV